MLYCTNLCCKIRLRAWQKHVRLAARTSGFRLPPRCTYRRRERVERRQARTTCRALPNFFALSTI